MHDIRGRKSLIPAWMLDAPTALTPDFFVNPRCPPESSSVLPTTDHVEITGKDLHSKDLPTIEGGVDIPSGPPAIPDKEPKVVTEG